MKKFSKINNKLRGFTIVELVAVIVIIGVLATVVYVSYTGLQSKSRDTSILSDLDTLDSLETNYELKNNVSGKDWYSGDGVDSDLNFTPSEGNVIDVVTDSSDYCIRGYSPSASKNSIDDAYINESSTDACNRLIPSSQASDPSSQANGVSIISSGNEYSCAMGTNDHAYCWGSNSVGWFGNNSTSGSRVPIIGMNTGVLSGITTKAVSSGYASTCVIASNNQAYCSGSNGYGQLGNNTKTSSSVPVAVVNSGVLNGLTIKAISRVYYHVCAIASDNQAYCWGNNGAGQLGNNTTTQSSVPVAVVNSGVLNGKTIKVISNGIYSQHSCAIASDNKVYCWGANYYGQLGNNTTTNSSVPVAVNTSGVLSGKAIKAISVDSNYSCAVAWDNKAYCWGRNNYGQLGNNSTNNSSVPVAVNTSGVLNGKAIKAISSGAQSADNNTCVIASDNKAYCWGHNGYGQLGNNTKTESHVPVAVNTSGVLGGKTLKYISVGGVDVCAADSNRQFYCWGYGGSGQLGNNSTTESLVPVAVNAIP